VRYVNGFGGTDWDLEVIKVLAEYINYISYHHYSAIGDRCFDMNDHLQLMAISESIDKDLNLVRSVIEAACGDVDSPIKIATDEWNMISWDFDKCEENSEHTLTNALITVSVLNTFIRNYNIVEWQIILLSSTLPVLYIHTTKE
jgi:alpha-L-arabinofuranosidase